MGETVGANLRTIHVAVSAGDARVMGKVVRSLSGLRRTMTNEVLRTLVEEVVDPARKSQYLAYVPPPDAPMTEEEKGKDKEKVEIKFPTFAKPYPPEFEA